MNGILDNKVIVDFGCGTGILGIGCLLLNAKKVYFVDIDKSALEIAKRNYHQLKLKKGVFVNKNVKDFDKEVDVVIENPPFGVQKEKADREFLDKAMNLSKRIYSFHKSESLSFLKKYCGKFNVRKIKDFNFRLPKTQKFHKSKWHYVKVGFFEIERFKS